MQFGPYFSKKKKFGDIHRDTHTHTYTNKNNRGGEGQWGEGFSETTIKDT